MLLLIVAAAVIWLALQPAGFELEVRRVIKATPETLFDTVRNYRTWPSWSPWLGYEPETQVTFADSPASVGGWYAWDGKKVGAGKMTHQQLTPHAAIRDQIEFLRPMKSVNEVYWQFRPQDDGTEVVWGMRASLPFFFRWLAGMIRRSVRLDYEIGLAQLAMYVGDDSDPLTLEFNGRVEEAAFKYVALHYAGSLDEMPAAMRAGFPRLAALVEEYGMQPSGLPLALYHKINPQQKTVDCDMAMPVFNPQAAADLRLGEMPAQAYARTTLTGPYHHLEKAWHAAFSYLRMQKWKFKKSAPLLERYLNDPQSTPPAEWKTALDIPLR
ncbi:MAG: GyrI-like domain-containing protein [Thiolinea sp.]